MFSQIASYLPSEAFIGILGTLLGTILGAFLNHYFSKQQEKKRLLADFYAEFVYAYALCIPVSSDMDNLNNFRFLIVSIEKLKLICPKAARAPLAALRTWAFENEWTSENVVPAYEEINKIIRRSLNN